MSDLEKHKKHLHNLLQKAIELEHSTIPPYLAAMFTIDENTNYGAYYAIRSVVMEEMLHMTLACNVMNATGGSPAIDQPQFVPEYPVELDFAGRDFDVGIVKFSKASIETFLKIEKPEDLKIPPGPDEIFGMIPELHIPAMTIGEFYQIVICYMEQICREYGEEALFSGDPSLQLQPEQFYGGGGEVTVVKCMETAKKAIHTITDQGEGTSTDSIWDGDDVNFDQEPEVAHYFMFNQIREERYYKKGDTPQKPPSGKKMDVNWKIAVNMIDNPKASHFPEGSEARQKADDFNNMYSNFLHLLHETFNGSPATMQQSVLIMYKLKYLALELLNIPVGDGKVAGPPFEFVPTALRTPITPVFPPKRSEEC